ncbi:MAG: efflux RND transporter periplasmic adaptor subunit [Pegethrix bostrychoides GSE-TBD4-15B]|jgi:HlyD family secretion protein|uniref:Efflux RND transporter periplasmic adaptor subunit n=1 Tax=Pegethrix bostrychoides GSE-TBD4-15B TaxID=2839662 RepID=A0A951P7U8_9CYAN|nr:efflux RND transporter periplasmic adaptor subunit [Pegethrix bostrychoides GSE-TBD4-15B]
MTTHPSTASNSKKNQPNPWLLGLVAAGIVGTGATTYTLVQRRSAPIDLAAMTVPVESESIQVRITASGTVQPIQTVNVSPKNPGILAELSVKQGDRVQKGQLLARMENDDAEAQLLQAQARVDRAEANFAQIKAGNRPEDIAQAEARVRQAEARVSEAQARVGLAEQKLDRNQSLASQGAISSDRLDEIRNEVDTAKANLDQIQAGLQESRRGLEAQRNGSRAEEIAAAAADLAEAKGNLQAAKVKRQDSFLYAPFSGIVTQKFADEGAFVTPTTSASEVTSATSTAVVAIAEGLEVLAEVPEVDVRELQVGQSVEIAADAYPAETFRGKVRLIAPEAVIKQNVTSFQVRVALDTGTEQLLSGMNTDVTFLGDEMQNAIVIPTVAIVTNNGETGVLIPNSNDQPEFRQVTLGTSVKNQTQILEGLEPGQRVFTDIPKESVWAKPKEQ